MALTRSEAVGLTIAAIGHLGLFGLLSVGFLATPNAEKLKPQPIAVSFAEDVGLESTAPELSSEEEAAKKSPVEAPVEPDTAPPEPMSEPEPAAKPPPTPPKPAPAPNAKPAPPTKPVPAAPTAAPRQPTQRPVRPTGNLDGLDLGRGNRDGTSLKPPATKISAQGVADISSAIQRQVQPCANRQVNPGPGADQIRVVVNLRINRDGSLAGSPRIVDHVGVTDENRRYVTRVDDAVRAIFAQCAPLRGLPPDLYDVQGGWKNFTLRYRLTG